MSTSLRKFLMMCACCLALPILAGQPGNGQNPGPGPGPGGGPGGGPGPGFGPGPMGFMRGNAAETVSRMTGIDIANTAASTQDPKLETLPLGGSRRLVINVPVGGIENPAFTGSGWKVESVFSLSAEQQAALRALRDEYDKEKRKLQGELAEAQKQLAQKAIQLRLTYEERANGLLSEADKETKLKMDALTSEASAKSEALVKDALNFFDVEDGVQMFALVNYLRERMNIVGQTENGLLQLWPADRKALIESVIRSNVAARQRMMMPPPGGGPPGGGPPGGGPRGGGFPGGGFPDRVQVEQAVKPPAPPNNGPHEF